MSKHRGAAPHTQEQHDEQLMRPDGHRYAAPESADERASKSWAYGALALLVVGLMVLVATGTVPIFPR